MTHPLFKELGITPKVAREILHKLETSTGQHSMECKAVSKTAESKHWDTELSLSFIQHFHKRLVTSAKSVRDITIRDWAAIRQAVSKKFPYFVEYSDRELLSHTRLLYSYSKVMNQVLRVPSVDFVEQFPMKYVFQMSKANWDSLIKSKPSYKRKHMVEFSKRADNRAVYEILEFQIHQKAKTFREKLGVKNGLIGAKRVGSPLKVARDKRRTI